LDEAVFSTTPACAHTLTIGRLCYKSIISKADNSFLLAARGSLAAGVRVDKLKAVSHHLQFAIHPLKHPVSRTVNKDKQSVSETTLAEIQRRACKDPDVKKLDRRKKTYGPSKSR
jgi:hypothetical protein